MKLAHPVRRRLGDRRTEHPRDQGERPVHVRHLLRCGPGPAHPARVGVVRGTRRILGDRSAQSFAGVGTRSSRAGFFGGFGFLIIGISSCILAYSGIESVVQTAGLAKSWRDTGKAYIFLAVTTGIFTPLISALVLSSGIDPAEHETDLITQFAASLNGVPFGLVVGGIASVALIMAVNTAFVASSELMERVAHRYNFTLDHQDQQPAVALPDPYPERDLLSPSSSCSPREARRSWRRCTPSAWWPASRSTWAAC